jgi:phenylpropionate dioxygenase-like ring-hydroxylating dioxygenase large terminal subunit
MLVTQHPTLRRFWYPIMPVTHLVDGPQSFQLLGEPIVLWLTASGQPAALADRCCHRSAQLSKGQVIDGCVRCPYHGWTYDESGRCIDVPQLESGAAIPLSYRVPAYQCEARYGVVWVCLDKSPLQPIPEIPEAAVAGNRTLQQFCEPWHCSSLQILENFLDNAHFSFVHTTTFGIPDQPKPPELRLEPFDMGFKLYSTMPVVNPPNQQENLKIAEDKTVRVVESTWHLPFVGTLKITYPNGLEHLIMTAATPIDDRTSQFVQFCIRNDTEADATAASINAFDRQVINEDKAILEPIPEVAPIEIAAEQHMPSDRHGVVMRRQLSALFKKYEQQKYEEAPAAETIVSLV